MATILLSAAGAALGGGFGGSFLGLSGAVIGRAIGATIGQAIDQKLLGSGSKAVETGKIDRFRLTGASEGAAVGQIWGRMRLAGQVIWASRFQETTRTSGGGKGQPPQPQVTEYTYSVSLTLALCEGEITRIGRLWADGVEISPDEVALRIYTGSESQLPDPKIEAVEGAGNAPAYRGIAYVVLEDLALGRFGNRVPQFTFEVVRAAQGLDAEGIPDLTHSINGVALIPGTGEYAMATSPVHVSRGVGRNVSVNVNAPGGGTDFSASLRALDEELPACGSVSLVVSWFGDDLRCAVCTARPKVEDRSRDGAGMEWRSGGIGRTAAEEVVRLAGRPAYGGTPADASVVEAIEALHRRGKSVVFYPFLLMDQLTGNGLPDPWSDGEQSALPWRGRITLSIAPGRAGTTDGSGTASQEVAAFFGTAQPSDFTRNGKVISYLGPHEWSYRRMILHYAHLCAAAGSVDAFCIGSELRGLTRIRGAASSFPAVAELRQLAADVRSILGPSTKLGYAADWSEYGPYQTPDGDLRFHLDPLWADGNIDFIGIDNYMPLSDWRDGRQHLDSGAGAIYSLPYLQSNIEGGEGFDWFYASDAERVAQVRTPITDDAYGEDWAFRFKDMRNWWANQHFDRIGGTRSPVPTAWVPQSKPIWFMEIGCPAVDKGTNEPNRFIDPKSSETGLPWFSNGRRDDLIQMQYVRATVGYWNNPTNNPVSTVYAAPMIDTDRIHVWAWDTRPYPHFPAKTSLWSDGGNYRLGHWLNGRVTAQPLARVVGEICQRSGLTAFDVTELYGLVRGYRVADVTTARAALQPLMIAHGFEAVERDGTLRFRMRDGVETHQVHGDRLAVVDESASPEFVRASEAEIAGRVRLSYIEADGDFEVRTVEAIFPDEVATTATHSEFPLSLTTSEAQRIADRWLAEARVARDTVRFDLPLSRLDVGTGDVVRLDYGTSGGTYRIDKADLAETLTVSAVRVETGVFEGSDASEDPTGVPSYAPPVPVLPLFLDLPLIKGNEIPHAPHLAAAAEPWPGIIAGYASDSDAGYTLDTTILKSATVGLTENDLPPAVGGLWDRGMPLRVRLGTGAFASAGLDQVLNGANLVAIGDGTSGNWELMQFAVAGLVEPDVYEVSLRLRGQGGTEHLAKDAWPSGSFVVAIDGSLRQTGLSIAERDLARHYRIGPSNRTPDDPSYVHLVESFQGIGLRPYAPAHVKSRRNSGALALSWIRRTRIGGDSWSGFEVPLNEAQERYLVRVVQGAAIVREALTLSPTWTYTATEQSGDGVVLPFELHVAQVSEMFGPGPFARITIDV